MATNFDDDCVPLVASDDVSDASSFKSSLQWLLLANNCLIFLSVAVVSLESLFIDPSGDADDDDDALLMVLQNDKIVRTFTHDFFYENCHVDFFNYYTLEHTRSSNQYLRPPLRPLQ